MFNNGGGRVFSVDRRSFLKLLGVSCGAAAASGSYYFYELDWIKLEQVTLSVPKNTGSFRIVQLSDLHIHGFGFRERMALNILGKLNPDVLVITGDFIDEPDGLRHMLSFVKEACTDREAYGVLGNWVEGKGGPSGDELAGMLCDHGVKMLINKAEPIRDGIVLIGVDDPHTRRDDVEEALRQVGSSEFKIMLAHSPEVVPNVEGRVDLLLAGHTHGGQVCLPIVGPLYVPSRLGKKYVSGLYRAMGTVVYVNRGLGWSFMPVRINCRPEITVIDLR